MFMMISRVKIADEMPEMPRISGQFDYDEIKQRHSVHATDTAWARLETLAKELGYRSRSDLIEAIGRDLLQISQIDIPHKTSRNRSKVQPNEISETSE